LAPDLVAPVFSPWPKQNALYLQLSLTIIFYLHGFILMDLFNAVLPLLASTLIQRRIFDAKRK